MKIAAAAEKSTRLMIAALIVTLTAAVQLTANDSWQFAFRTSAGVSLSAAGDSAFTYPAGADLTEAGVSLGLDGTVYAASKEGILYAVDSLGHLLWSYDAGEPIYSAPLVSSDGALTFAAGSEVIRLDAAGNFLWQYPTAGTVFAPLAETVDGTIYVSDFNRNFYAIAWDGSLGWEVSPGSDIFGTVKSGPVIAGDGTIYVGHEKLYALDNEGTVLRSYEASDGRPSAQAVPSGNGLIYFPTAKSLSAVDTTGALIWRYPAGSYASPVLDNSGNLYYGSVSDSLYVLNALTGAKIRVYSIGADVYHTAVTVDGTLFAGAADSTLYAYDSQGALVFSFKAGGSIEGAIAVNAGRVFFSATDGVLYGVETESAGPDSLSWSTHAGSNQRRSRAEKISDTLEAGDVRHVFRSGSSIFSSAAMDKNGNYYFGSHEGYLYCVSSSGDLRWKFLASGEISQSPALGADGSIFFGTATGTFYSLTEAGKLRWSFTGSGNITGMTAVRADGATFFRQDGVVRALAPLGNEMWTYPVAQGTGNIIVDGAGTLYFTVSDTGRAVFAVSSEGKLKWRRSIQDSQLGGHLAISPDSAIYVIGTGLHRLNYGGALDWSMSVGELGGLTSDRFLYSPVVGEDSTVYAADNTGGLYALKADKSLVWKTEMGAAAAAAPLLSSDGRVYVPLIGNSLAAFEIADGTQIWKQSYGLEFDTSDLSTFLNLTDNGDLILNSRNAGMLVASSGSTSGLDSLGWAKPGKDAGNSANASAVFVPPVKNCDFSGDGFVSISDVIFMLLRGNDNPADPALDWNNDGRYTIADAIRLLFDIRDGLCPNQNAVLASAGEINGDDIDELLAAIERIGLSDDERKELVAALDNLSAASVSLPLAFRLEQNHPNPFNPSTTISFQLPGGAATRITLKVYDLRGKVVRTLIDDVREPGVHTAFWDGRDDSGRGVASGVYLYRLKAGDFSQTRKMVLLK